MDILEKPDESDCCGSGCTPCILDVYEAEINKRNKKQTAKFGSKNVLSTIKYTIFKVAFIERIQDHVLLTFDYVFEGNNPEKSKSCLKFNPGQYFIIRTSNPDDKSSHFTRPYTPIGSPNPIFFNNKISSKELSGNLFFQIIVKIYKDGLMTQYLENLQIGDITMWRGPYGSFEYKMNNAKDILMICQGTAIAPMFAIINEIINNDEDETRIMLYYYCKNIKNVIFRNELYEFKQAWNFSYQVFLSEYSTDDKNALKYKECINNRRLDGKDVQCYLSDKNNVNILIAGSESFMLNFDTIVKRCNVSDDSIFLFK
ncbi:NADH-cytochrome b5 reductase-like [Arctopsyche grandis]|uniref:NADH-cytochrome b5 reductase-like n=1 Tax=Arctopsyche grandis TaxID=121162 RepID=UPI00406D981A